MSIGALDATAAYGRILDATKIPKIAETETTPGTGSGFGSMVEKLVSDAATNMRAAENASAKQVAGKGDLIDVVTAVGAAETALDTVVAVRDRMVNAYSEIMRMQI
ncbi:flagellar hook-basal body complex protein FliE [Sphingomonas sp. HMWF008]|nr:flagellar hook-basal body complex protein FliE [Sphingomonas sp. HMWF008]